MTMQRYEISLQQKKLKEKVFNFFITTVLQYCSKQNLHCCKVLHVKVTIQIKVGRGKIRNVHQAEKCLIAQRNNAIS